MKKILRQILSCALILIFSGSACGVLTKGFPARKDATPSGQTRLPAATATSPALSSAPLIPITGDNVVFLQCQFCVGAETHAVLIIPDSAYFDVDQSSPASCLTADDVNGRRIVICRGPQATTFNLSVCSDPSNCLQFPVTLLPCDQLRGSVTTFPAVILTPISKRNAGSGNNSAPPVNTPTPLPPVNPPGPTNPPEPTKEPKPTNEPKPTHEPKPTPEPKPTHEPKPTKPPKPTKGNH